MFEFLHLGISVKPIGPIFSCLLPIGMLHYEVWAHSWALIKSRCKYLKQGYSGNVGPGQGHISRTNWFWSLALHKNFWKIPSLLVKYYGPQGRAHIPRTDLISILTLHKKFYLFFCQVRDSVGQFFILMKTLSGTEKNKLGRFTLQT